MVNIEEVEHVKCYVAGLQVASEFIDGPMGHLVAMAILPGMDRPAVNKPARDYVSDTYAHCTFMSCNEAGRALV